MLECVSAGPFLVENYKSLQMTVHVKDCSGNFITDSQVKLVCKVLFDFLPVC